jgi:hypothetical protein
MALVTREELGRKLTIQEMDGNLIYLQSLANIPGVINETTYTSLPVTTEQVLSMTLIPANTFKDLDAVELKALLIKPLENGYVTSLSAYLNTSASLSGANSLLEIIASGNSGVNTLNAFIINTFINVIRNNKIKGTTRYGNSGVSLNQLISSVLPLNSSELPFDPTIDNYLIITVSLASTLDVITQESLIFKKIN